MNISFSKLNNDKLYTFSKRVHEILSPAPVAEMGIQLYFDEYVVEHEKYKAAMLKLKEAQKILGEKDRKRDKDGINLRTHVKNYTNHPNEQVAEKAGQLLAELDRHGVQFYKKSYKEQTAILEYIFNAIDTNFTDFIARIHADEWYGFLKESQNDFETTRKSLTEKNAEAIDEESPSKIRPDLVAALRNLFTFMPLQYKVNNHDELGKVIAQIEAEIKRF
jgi:hypothetical protein